MFLCWKFHDKINGCSFYPRTIKSSEIGTFASSPDTLTHLLLAAQGNNMERVSLIVLCNLHSSFDIKK